MKYDIIYSIAIDTVRNRALNRITNNQNDTISVLYTSSGATYVGVNTADIRDGKLVNGCSEKDAVKNMLTKHESVIKAIVTINVYTLVPILPCSECIDLILGLNPENTQCLVVSPNKRYISIGDVPNYEQNVEDIEGFAESLELDPLNAISPMNMNTSNVRNSAYMNVNSMSMANSQYMPYNSMTSQYIPNNGMTSQYMPNNGMTSQYVPNNAMVSQYIPNNAMVSQYIPNNAMTSQYVQNVDFTPPNVEGDGSSYLNKKLSNLLDFDEEEEEEVIKKNAVKNFADKRAEKRAEKKAEKEKKVEKKAEKKADKEIDIEKEKRVEKDREKKIDKKADKKVDKKVDKRVDKKEDIDIREGKKNLLRLAKERKKQAKHAMKIDEQFKTKS